MTAPFVSQLRARDAIRLGAPGEATISVRVQMPETWDVVRFDVPPTHAVRELKERALERLAPDAQYADDYVIKLRGWEILDERATLADVGAANGSTFLVTSRRRRPVR